MPRPEIDWGWRRRIYAQAANHEGRGGHFIRARLVEAWGDVSGLPTPKTIDKYLLRFREELSDAVRRDFRMFAWPESMIAGLLPWEASATTLELIQLTGFHPSVRVARWFYHATLAAPDAPVESRLLLAHVLSFDELQDDADERRMAEMYLTYAPWRGDEARKRYGQAIEAAGVRRLRVRVPLMAQTEAEAEVIEDALSWQFSKVEAKRQDKKQEEKPCADETKEASTSAKTAAGRRQSPSAGRTASGGAKRSTARRGKRSQRSSQRG